MKIDMTGVKAPGPVPAGDYTVVCTQAEEDIVQEGARNEGEPLLKLAFQVSEGEFDGKKIWDNMVITPGNPDKGTKDTRWRCKQLLTAVGKETDGEIDFDAEEDILGHELVVSVVVQEGNEKPGSPGEYYADKNQIRAFKALNDSAPSLR